MSESPRVTAQITFEMEQIDHLFVVYADLLARVMQRNPDTVEIAAVSSVLHSFYNGIGNVFLLVAKNIDQDVPTGSQSHRDLLLQMTKPTNKRGNVISKETAKRLADYLGFRHFYRHSYSFFIDWAELQKLVLVLREVWEQTRSEFSDFVGTVH